MTPRLLAQLAELHRREARDARRARSVDADYLDERVAKIDQEVARLGFVGDPFSLTETKAETKAETKVGAVVDLRLVGAVELREACAELNLATPIPWRPGMG